MDDNGQNPGRRRSHRKLWIALAVVVVLVMGGSLYLVLSGSILEKRLADLRAEGYPTSFAELVEYNKLPERVENAAGIYEEAFYSLVPPGDANVPVFFGGRPLPGKGEPLPEAMAQAISKCLDDNEKCLGLLRDAGSIEHCRYAWDYTATMLPNVREVKQCARLLELAAVFSAHEGDGGAAVGFIKDGLRLADSLEGEPFLINHIVRSGCIGASWAGLEQVLNVTSLTDEQLKDLRESLARTLESIDLAKVMVTELCCTIECFSDPAMLPGLGRVTTLMNVPIIGKRGLLDSLDFMGDCIEAAKLEGTERRARFSEIEKEVEDLPFFHVVIKMLPSAMSTVGVIDLRIQGSLRLSQAAIAVERYRLAKGELPARLEELAGEYLEAVPIDPFDDKPIKYKRTEPGYVLWSVGEDGKDNGGVERDRKKKDQPWDITFVVTR